MGSLGDDLAGAHFSAPQANLLQQRFGAYSLDSSGNVIGLVGPSGTIPLAGISAEGFGASPSASAAVNTAAIQAALNRTGAVTLTTPGTYLINAALTINSNTNFMVGQGVTIKHAAGSNTVMLQTASFLDAGTSITIAWTAGLIATVTWTAHGKTDQDYVFLRGATQLQYRGVFPVYQVIDANTFTVLLNRLPSVTATGTILGVSVTKNWSVFGGGQFDYDYTNNPSGTGAQTMTILAYSAANFVIDNIKTLNGYKYGIYAIAVTQYSVSNFTARSDQASSSGDAVKTTGPATHGFYKNISGFTTDDLCTLEAELPAAFSAYDLAGGGDVINITYDGIFANASAGAIVCGIYTGDQAFVIDQITYRNVSGTQAGASGTGISLKYGSGFSLGQIGTVTIELPTVKANAPTTQFGISCSSNIRRLNIRNGSFYESGLTQVYYKQTGGNCNLLDVDGVVVDDTNWPSSAIYMFSLAAGTCDVANFRNCVMNANLTNARFVSLGNTQLLQANFENCNFLSGSIVAVRQSGAPNTVLITFKGCTVQSFAQVVQPLSACDITLLGNLFSNISLQIVRANAAVNTIIRGSGNKQIASTLWASFSSATVDIISPDLQQDISATGVNATLGNMVYNSSATPVPGTGLVTADGTSWRRVAAKSQVVASSATPALNCNLGNVVTFTATAASLWGAPTNVPANGERVTVIVTQDGTGGWAITWNAAYIFPTAWTNTGNTANQISEITFVSNGTKLVAQGANLWHA